MKNFNRREFIQKGAAGFAGITFLPGGISSCTNTEIFIPIDKVKLGDTGLIVSRLAFGTGTNGSNQHTNQTKLGLKTFLKLARHAYESGIHFFDTADLYGSHTLFREVFKEIPRENITLLTKMWTIDTSWNRIDKLDKTIDRFRMETGSDYFDILLLHCMTNGNWKIEKKQFIDILTENKEKGIIKKVGVSCHDFEALKVAAEDPWTDVILARINPFGSNMDASPEEVMQVLETARKNCKGIIGMKIYGNGLNTSRREREQSLRFAINSKNIHCMTIGVESINQITISVNQIMDIVNFQ